MLFRIANQRLANKTVEKKDLCPVGIRLLGMIVVGFAVTLGDGKPIAAQSMPTNQLKGTVILGTDDLTSGIPSWLGSDEALRTSTGNSKSLTIDALRAWLADDDNHRPLTPRLPLGLSTAQSELVGIEKNQLTRAKIELGRQLFFDKRLSHDETVSCASCHSPEHSFASSDRIAIGVNEQLGVRNAPTIINRILSSVQFHDGRVHSLEEQAIGPIENKIEMGLNRDELIKRLAEIEGYRLQFEAIFDSKISIDNITAAIASFERTLVSGASAWDHHARLSNFESTYADDLIDRESLKEEDPELAATYDQLLLAVANNPISPAAKRGGKLFFSQRVNCASCHAGANFTDESFHNLGIGLEKAEAKEIDWGRATITQQESDKGAFKTPTLRNVALTAPYMHDGSLKSLEEVIAWYVEGGHPNAQLSDLIEPLEISEAEQADLVAFLKSLTGALPTVSTNGLPE